MNAVEDDVGNVLKLGINKMEKFFHSIYRKFNFLEKYLGKYLEESNLVRVLNFIDLKLIDREYILTLFVIWSCFFCLFLITYIILFFLNSSFLLPFIILTQLFLGVFILFSYLYPFIKAKNKLKRIEGEIYYFVSYLHLLSSSGLNFSNILSFLFSLKDEKLKFPTIHQELIKIVKISKISGKSIKKACRIFFSNYPNCEFKKLFLSLLNVESEKGKIKEFLITYYKDLCEKRENEEKKFYQKLDLLIIVYLVFLLILPFFLILLFFIFDMVDNMMSSLSQISSSSLFLKVLYLLLLFLPLAYILFYLIIDCLKPSHLKIEEKR